LTHTVVELRLLIAVAASWSVAARQWPQADWLG